jgi:hypothetical protein
MHPRSVARRLVPLSLGSLSATLAGMALLLAPASGAANSNVFVSRFWHNHQPIYWPEWNGNGPQNQRVQLAWDSIILKGGQTYGTGAGHPDNDLVDIFGKADRVTAYQGGPRDSLTMIPGEAGYAMSYSGSLIENVHNLGANGQLGYGGGWWNGNREARNWGTPGGGRRMDLVGFTYHHSLAPLLPKEVFRKELQIFKQAWWKAWGGNSNLSDHSRGFFPTEMAFTREMVDVLVDEGYQWSIVASHHLSRTCPTYNVQANPNGNFTIKSSPPNAADQIGPSPGSGWWFSEPNPGQGAWNVAPFAYQLHRAKYVNPDTGAEKRLILVPSDDVQSYVAGYSGAQKGLIDSHISPFATDPARPVIVLPSTDGDNAWGGGSSSYLESTPSFFNACKGTGYRVTSIQDFVNWHGGNATDAHVEDGAWIFPESDYGSPYFLKWIEPPVGNSTSPTKYPGTVIDLETPGFALKFWSWAPVITGANWVETAEQILRSEGGDVQAWKIQAPYDNLNGGGWTSPNEVERAWHIYLAGLDSGFNYYGGLGNDDEVKPSLATRRAIELLTPWMTPARRDNDQTPPSVLRPQRFPWNPGTYTFGWFNSIPGGDTRYLKQMPSDFYIWTHAYDLNGIGNITVKVRTDNDGTNTLANNQNETYAGGPEVGSWISLPMTKRVLPNSQAALNAAANNGQINYFITPPELADYYFVKVDGANVPGFRGKLLDYYIEATDTRNNTHRSEIQHVFVADDGAVTHPPATPGNVTATGTSSTQITVAWSAVPDATGYVIRRDGIEVGTTGATSYIDGPFPPSTTRNYTVAARNAIGDSPPSAPVSATTQPPPPSPDVPTGLTGNPVSHTQIDLSWNASAGSTSYVLKRNGITVGTPTGTAFADQNLSPSTLYAYTVAGANGVATSPDSASLNVSTPAPPQNYTMDGAADFPGYRVNNPGMTIYAALRGSRLYVATWSPGNDAAGLNDHFIFVTDTLLPGATANAPWGKNGTIATAATKPFLAGESINTYAGWTNAPSGSEVAKAPVTGGQLEGSIDLAAAFGTVPPVVYIAAVAYQTANGGILGGQAPAGNGDGNLDPAEFFALPTASIRDSAANGIFDALDPGRAFRLDPRTFGAAGLTLAWPAVPGRTYRLWHSPDLAPGHWEMIDTRTAPPGAAEIEVIDADATGDARGFYTTEALAP